MNSEAFSLAPIRHALIIAAGRGRRFLAETALRPKPLIELNGRPLILHVLGRAAQAGIDRVTVITGYRADVLEDCLSRDLPAGMKLDCLYNPEWERANGVSVLKARGFMPRAFALLMSDHLFDPEMLRKLAAAPIQDGYCRLAVDFDPAGVPDLTDATKVRCANGLVLEIGKEITGYNGIDTGVFLCTEGIFTALEVAVAGGAASLSDGVRKLAHQGKMEAVDVSGLFWRDIDDEPGLRNAKAALGKGALGGYQARLS